MKTITKLFAAALLATTGVINASAQKDPQIQQVSLRAPDNMKVDGFLNEWPQGHLQAYNSTDRLYYTICNDDNYLYLATRGLGPRVSIKALTGGITFTISHSTDKRARKKAGDNVAVTFPVPMDDEIIQPIMLPVYGFSKYAKTASANRSQIDSLAAVANKKFTELVKEVIVVGIKEIPDSVISMYNIQGIKVAGRFENGKLLYVYELAIPLKYLGLSADRETKFSYNIKMGVPPAPANFAPHPISPNGIQMTPDADTFYVIAATDFWGEYTLAKKP
jgi:hypothetical protein